MSKHFNQAHVWGRIAEVPKSKKSNEGKGPVYLKLKLNCYSPRMGNLLAWANLWGKQDIDQLLAAYRQDPRRLYKFTGYVSQYEKDGKRYTNFTFYQWTPAPDAEPRAAFILVGEVAGIEGEKILLQLKRPKSGNGEEIVEENFELILPAGGSLNGAVAGDTVKAKCYLRTLGEDDFGENSSPVRPYVEEVEVRKGETPF